MAVLSIQNDSFDWCSVVSAEPGKSNRCPAHQARWDQGWKGLWLSLFTLSVFIPIGFKYGFMTCSCVSMNREAPFNFIPANSSLELFIHWVYISFMSHLEELAHIYRYLASQSYVYFFIKWYFHFSLQQLLNFREGSCMKDYSNWCITETSENHHSTWNEVVILDC